MSTTSLTHLLGLSPSPTTGLPPPSHGANYLIGHFIFAYAVLSTRAWKIHYKLDHQVSPREDLGKYGAAAVSKGRLTQARLDQIRRVDACHANSVEHFALFAAAMVLAHVGGVPPELVNRMGLSYSVARGLYAAAYIFVGPQQALLSYSRAVFWWASNVICFRMLWASGKAINAKLV